jgi:hypothetical protein
VVIVGKVGLLEYSNGEVLESAHRNHRVDSAKGAGAEPQLWDGMPLGSVDDTLI